MSTDESQLFFDSLVSALSRTHRSIVAFDKLVTNLAVVYGGIPLRYYPYDAWERWDL